MKKEPESAPASNLTMAKPWQACSVCICEPDGNGGWICCDCFNVYSDCEIALDSAESPVASE